MSRRTAAALMITRGEGRALEVYLAERAIARQLGRVARDVAQVDGRRY